MEELTVFEVMKALLLWLSPLILLEGLLLLVGKTDKYNKLEQHLGKDIGGIRKRLIPKIESDIFTFQNWLLKKKYFLGLIFIIFSIMLFMVLRK